MLPSPVIPTRLIRFMDGSVRKCARIAVCPSTISKIKIGITNISNQQNKIGMVTGDVVNSGCGIVCKTQVSNHCYSARVALGARNWHSPEVMNITHC